jgi:integrase
MSREGKGPYLNREADQWKNGKIRRHSTWVIRDGRTGKRRTGVSGSLPQGHPDVQAAFAAYLAEKEAKRAADYQAPRRRNCRADQILIAEALAQYVIKLQRTVRPPRLKEAKARIANLGGFWRGKTLDDINPQSCGAYIDSRVGQPWKSARPEQTGMAPRLVGTAIARRELEDLRAAINWQMKQGRLREIVAVTLPPKSKPRSRALDRSEAARLLWAAWRGRQIMRDGVTQRATGKHIARFILIGLYTGTRSSAICDASMVPNIDGRGYVDLDAGLFYRRANGVEETKKRQPTCKIAPRLLAHMRRWRRLGASTHAVIEWNGKAISSARKGFRSAVLAAGIERPDEVVPHIMRHTAATWMMADPKLDPRDVAEYLGMTEEVLRSTYNHHRPDYQSAAVASIGTRRARGGGAL